MDQVMNVNEVRLFRSKMSVRFNGSGHGCQWVWSKMDVNEVKWIRSWMDVNEVKWIRSWMSMRSDGFRSKMSVKSDWSVH